MHDYSIDTHIRQKVNVAIAVISLSLPGWITWALSHQSFWKVGTTFAVSFGLVFSILEWAFDRWIWRWLSGLMAIPDLNGTWDGKGISSWINPETGEEHPFEIMIKIRQTFTKIEIHGETDQSTSRSFMASFETQHAVTHFRYGFENSPKNMATAELQRHSGMMDLMLDDEDTIKGGYFSGKHRIRYGELCFRKRKS
jgi:hypothetical protein